MFKKAMLFLASFLLASAFAYAEENFTISGEVNFQYDGDIYVCLLTQEGLRDFTIPGHILSQSKCKFIPMDEDLKKTGRVPFSFDNVPRGTYTILTYQDINNNGEVDFENYAINEPWGSYREIPYSSPIWKGMKFDLGKNMTGIKIDM